MTQLPKHLGGHLYMTHIDEGALNYLINHFHIKTMYDVGCGPGGMVNLAISKNIDAIGIDGDFTITYPSNLKIIIHDFTDGPLDVNPVDLSWSCEFLEHVEEKYLENYFSVFRKSKIVCCTFATKGSKRGHHHVNVKDQAYWDEKFTKRGFIKNIEATKELKSKSTMARNFIRTTGTIYINQHAI